jgi:hypothetical protein
MQMVLCGEEVFSAMDLEELYQEIKVIIDRLRQEDPRVWYKELAKKVNPSMNPECRKYFFQDDEILDFDPTKIEIKLSFVQSKEEKNIFSSAMSFWSMPISRGYGRRIHIIVWDSYHQKVLGIVGLCDPVIGLKVRDDFIKWGKEQRYNRLYNVMTAYVLGAVPPYNRVLGAKLVAMVAGSKEVSNHFEEKYSKAVTIIRKRKPINKLVAIDTMGAFGQSAIYHQLKMWKFIGYTQGKTHYHITLNKELWEKIYKVANELELNSLRRNVYGNGANWKFRILQELFAKMGKSREVDEILYTGHKRAYYFNGLASNWREFLNEETDDVIYSNKTAMEYFELWKNKFLRKGVKRWGT